MDKSEMQDRMAELMLPIEKQIMMCDNRQDLLMMACAMLQHVNTIFAQELGEEGRQMMFRDMLED
jgi:hypothetical protein